MSKNRSQQASKNRRRRIRETQHIRALRHTRIEKKLEDSNKEKERRAAWVAEQRGDSGMRMCGSKRKYSNKREALISIERRNADYPLRAYHCPICGGWHITHTPKRDDEDSSNEKVDE